MERLNNYTISTHSFTVRFFRLVLLLAATVIVLLFTLRINDTVPIKEGEILSANPQSDYKAPFEARLVKVLVREGQHVQAGDTLVVLDNPENRLLYLKKQLEIDYLQKRLQSLGALSHVLQQKRAGEAASANIDAGRYRLNSNRISGEIKALNEQVAYQQERLSSAGERYRGDSLLFKKDMLSRAELNATKDAGLVLKESITELESRQRKQLAEQALISNNFSKDRNDLFLDQARTAEEEQRLLQTASECQYQLLQAREVCRQLETELSRQYLFAEQEGIVNHIFSIRQTSNLIAKGELLVSIAPPNRSYYAKAVIPQKELRFVKKGLDARLKLDTYARFEQGIIRGKITYTAERKENDQYYAIIRLLQPANHQLRPGYTFNGEIVIERMPLYRFMIKKLFKRFDSQ
ncbi:MAG: HlyD family efflux transporter periplasmic adaptor subunit [Williamsia sp.]|nr:HlyD family efflux transporter periplasmic adaptor subunit [Williamsia sp.]